VSLPSFDPQELRRFAQVFEELFYASDPASMTSYYTEGAHLIAEGMQPIQGHAAITQFWRAAITRAAAARAQRTIQLHESHSSGDFGYALSSVTVQIPAAGDAPGASGTDIVAFDATIWQRDPGGTWRIAVDISTPVPRSPAHRS
jgi:ketosteroid isomerase-like protein